MENLQEDADLADEYFLTHMGVITNRETSPLIKQHTADVSSGYDAFQQPMNSTQSIN